ncbi:outer membrane beta-barrel protein [Vibrio comitans]|uniref:Outer membrane protein beta-barrel domain-containing protein n=1 Tax=Vibrio comitans NBRC 102076 TaxID=1219078 RepID=A0A4Y3IT04_9VIBR|nr:outer membrane beta-barrel protein [Vibrio comitans]GEA61928.1 hypothetical protein VCO01S_31210 [Vibrio comitans NBRC 102076]
MKKLILAIAMLPAFAFSQEPSQPELGISYREPENNICIEFMSSSIDGNDIHDRGIGGVVNFDVNHLVSISTAYQRLKSEKSDSEIIQPQLNIGYTWAFDDAVHSQIKPYLIVGWNFTKEKMKASYDTDSYQENALTYGVGLRSVSFGFLSSSIEYKRSDFMFSEMDQLSFSLGVAF